MAIAAGTTEVVGVVHMVVEAAAVATGAALKEVEAMAAVAAAVVIVVDNCRSNGSCCNLHQGLYPANLANSICNLDHSRTACVDVCADFRTRPQRPMIG